MIPYPSFKFKIFKSCLIFFFFAYSLMMITSCSVEDKHSGGKETPFLKKTSTVKKRDLVQKITVVGNIAPSRRMIITAPYSGNIEQIFVKVGQKVITGAPLVTISQGQGSIGEVYPLRAPYGGVVTHILKTEGEFVKVEDDKDYIMRIDNRRKLYIKGEVAELNRHKVKIGQECTITLPSNPDAEYKGKVVELALSSSIQQGWRNQSKVEFPVIIEVIDPSKDLVSDLSAIANIITLKKEKVLTLAQEFVYKKEDRYFVYKKDNESKQTEIEIGEANESYFEIIKGLNEGDKVHQINFVYHLDSVE